MTEEWTEDARVLKLYLDSYQDCKRQVKALEQRRREIIADFEFSPLSAIVADGMPHGSSSNVGAASLALKLDNIDTKIVQQLARMKQRLEDIMTLLDLLPEGSEGRNILEARILDNISIERASFNFNVSMSTGYRLYRKAIYDLLECPETLVTIEAYKRADY